MRKIVLSQLKHTWLIDIDGTIVKHNGHKSGKDELLPGVEEFWQKIPPEDVIILMTARTEKDEASTIETLKKHGLRFDKVIFDLPTGERILVNDIKPQGLSTAIATNLKRDEGMTYLDLEVDHTI